MKPKMKVCPECDGACEFETVVGENRSGLGGISPIVRYSKCKRCGGLGEIEDEEAGEDEGERAA